MGDEPERPATIEFWVICRRCGRIDLDASEFMYPIRGDPSEPESHVAFKCPGCDDWAQLYMGRTLKPLQ